MFRVVYPILLMAYDVCSCAEELVGKYVQSNSIIGLGTGVMVWLMCSNNLVEHVATAVNVLQHPYR